MKRPLREALWEEVAPMPDPFESLRRDDAPIAPDPAFAARLRRQIEAALTPGATVDDEETAMPEQSPLVPYLAVRDAASAITFYTDVFGAVETMRYDDGQRIGHAELVIGTARMFLSDEFPEMDVAGPASRGGTTVSLYLEVPDVDYSHERAVRYGATSQRPPTDQGHGSRTATIVDPFGHRWMLSSPIVAERAQAAGAADPNAGQWEVTGRKPVEVGYLTMPTADVAVASAFFRKVFDWEVDPAGGHIGNTKLPMGMAPSGQWGDKPVLYFRVDDVQPYLERALAAGATLVKREEHPSGDDAECVDDQGFTFHLWRPAPGY
jgi:uncharacterized glyoxalase superfamily protein PhnB